MAAEITIVDEEEEEEQEEADLGLTKQP